ncbi:MAG TPA: hypothetical protein P5294_06285 [Smithellaceae bacterium]|nr:hypothetical protein [Smithellaceae bacterium]HRV26126.1 hypothetical protein [Smithellaceae bacterium]
MKISVFLMKKIIKKQSGATLIAIIVTMLVLAVIGAAIYSLTYTASLNQVVAQRAAKAFYIAESCVRVAASEYKAVANKNTTLISLHNQTFPMPGNQGSCTVLIYPYWFYARAAYAAGTSSITLYLPGDMPKVDEDGSAAISLFAGGNLKIKGASGAVAVFSNASIGTFNGSTGTPVTFTLSAPFSVAIAVNDEFYIGYNYTSSAPAPNPGGNLILNISVSDTNDDMAKIFPPSKGSIFVDSGGAISQYVYEERIINTASNPHTVTLTNIQAVPGAPAPVWPVAINDTPIYMGRSLGLRSTSTYGD